MGLTLAQLREDVLDDLGMDTDDITQTKLDRALNKSYWEVTKKLKFRETDSQFYITLVAGTTNYDYTAYVSDFDAIRHVTIQDVPNASTTWQEVEQTDYENLMNDWNDDNVYQSMPTKYARYGNDIVFNWAPTGSYVVKVAYRKSLGDILVSGPSIPEEWHEIIQWGASSRLWESKGFPMRADRFAAKQATSIQTMIETESKEDRDYAFSAGRTVRRRYP